MVQSLYLGRVGYDDGLRLQAELADLVAEGRLEDVLLLLEHPPVLTLGRNANRTHVLASDEALQARGMSIHQTRRGGDVTYHGPGQLVGYPIFNLRRFRNRSGSRMGPVDFVRGMEDVLIRVCAAFGLAAGRVTGLTGAWCGLDHPGRERKIAAIGIHVARGITSHGFALNVTTRLSDFDLIVPCGIADHAVTSLARELKPDTNVPPLQSIAQRVAQEFGAVFSQPILAVESLSALRAGAAGTAREFPAEDIPIRVPAEVERLQGIVDAPVQA